MLGQGQWWLDPPQIQIYICKENRHTLCLSLYMRMCHILKTMVGVAFALIDMREDILQPLSSLDQNVSADPKNASSDRVKA